MVSRFLVIAAPLLALALPALAAPLSFDLWTEQRFKVFSSVDFSPDGESMRFAATDTASLMWQKLPRDAWGSTGAKWDWTVSQSVPATDLTVKGGDDRNAAVYFVFLPRAGAEAIDADSTIRSLLADDTVRVLVYVWGGDHERGDLLPSPYLGNRGVTVVLRPAGTGEFSETVDLAVDYQSAFGDIPETLVGVAVSADSDDTDSTLDGRISGLMLR